MLVRAAWGFTAAVLVVVQLASPVQAAKPPIEHVGTLDATLPADANQTVSAARNMMFDTVNRRAIQIAGMQDFTTLIRAWDLDTRKLLLQKRYPLDGVQPAIAGTDTGGGMEFAHAFDHDRGLLYVAYSDSQTNGGPFAGVLAFDVKTLAVVHKFPRPLVYHGIDPANPGCTSASCQPQSPLATPGLRGMSLVPSVLSGASPKLLFLLADVQPAFTEQNFGMSYIVQWDAINGKQDYLYRIQGCSNSKLTANIKYQTAVFQARLTSGIYVACQASGGAGQVVRIDFDSNGRPSTEATFPGPLRPTDSMADVEDDRTLIRVQNEEGESWWIYSGSDRAFTGIVGITPAPVSTAAGLDATSGRFYAVAPPSGVGRNSSKGGLLVSDIRRAPAPQALQFEEFATPAEGRIQIDVSPTTGDRLIYYRKAASGIYQILRDNLEISYDTPDSEQDSLTAGVEEKPGVTAANFGGSGHAYGLRTLLVGGIQGFPPTGPDVSGFRIGRIIPQMLGSPCGPGNRELVAASVRNASLSNSLASAAAGVADVDTSSKQDAREPTGRCYPRPTDQGGEADLWDQVVAQVRSVNPGVADQLPEYPRPVDQELDDQSKEVEGRNDLDEVAGTDWPFAPVECSGDAKADTGPSRLHPLDRGDPDQVGEPPANPELTFEKFNATANCGQQRARVEASAQMLADERQAPAFEQQDVPGLGMIRVGDVSSKVITYVDPARGLVTRSTAVARAISIGDHLFIDEASMTAEAWAHGTAGTASTSYQRRLCGVHTKDEAPDQKVHRPIVEPDTEDPANSRIDPTGGPEVKKGVDADGCGSTPAVEGQPSAIDLINRALGSRARASAPLPDGVLSQGTPGGYLASVQRDRYEQISAQQVNNDSSTQVPALEIIVFNDEPIKGRARQVYQFAGVDASVTYGIYLLNPEENFTDPGPTLPEVLVDYTGGTPFAPPATDNAPPVQQVGSGPLHILYEGVRLLLRSPREALLAAAVWLLFFAPVQLAGRRRVLRALGP